MSMYSWHGSTATTSTGHRTHPHPQQQQQQQQQHRHQRQHLPHLPHHTANAAAPAAAAAASNPRIDSTSTTITPTAAPPSTSAAALQMPQMPWLPSMISARANPQHATLPNLSTNLRLRPQPTPQPTALDTQQQHQHHSHPHSLSRHSQQQQQQQQQPVPMVIDARQQQQQQQQKQKPRQQKQQQAVSISSEESDFDTSDCSVRHITTADALGDQDYVSSDGMGANTIARARSHARAQQQQQQRRHGHHPVGGGNGGTANSTAITTPSNSQRDGPIPNGNATTTRSGTTATTILIDGRDDLDLDATAAGNDSADNSLNITGDREGPRKHGKRLTTLEEVSLFDICNRHAHEFGQRSNLCKWWMTVTEEFTRDQGHPYSWHSVRRKVELVTKQRMKFLDEQRERGGSERDDRSNLRWRAAVDAWIPTWQRWEEAEARRIEKRDSRRPRKRKDREWEVWVNGNNDGVSPSLGAWRATGSVSGSGSPLVNVGGAAAQLPTPSQQALSTPPASTPQHTKVRLPPGFDNMFASQPQSQYHTPTPAPATMLGGAGRPSLDGSLALQQLNSTPSGGEAGNAESSSMMSAVLETLGKLNRHLDAANPTTTLQTSFKPLETTDSRSRAAAAAAAAAATAQQQQPQQPSHSQSDTSSNPDDPPSPTQAPKMSQVSSLPIPTHLIAKLKAELREEMREEMRSELAKDRASLEEKLDSVQRTQEMILEMLRQEPS